MCGNMLEGLGTKLRILGCDCIIQAADQTKERVIEILQKDEALIFLSSGKYDSGDHKHDQYFDWFRFAQMRIAYKLPNRIRIGTNRCIKVDQRSKVDQQLIHLLKHYNLKLDRKRMFTRCTVCLKVCV